MSKQEWRNLPGPEFRARLFAILDDPNWGKQHAEHKKQRHLAKGQLKALIAEREDSQRTRCRTAEQVTPYTMERKQHHKEDTPKVHLSPNNFKEREQHLEEQEAIIRKVAPEPSSLASFNEDLEKEIDMTNLKECVPKAHHAYLDIFSERCSQ